MNSKKEEKYDVIIIGAGQAGKPLAIYLAKADRKVAIIEREHLGGSCVNYGCTPTKMLLASANTAHQARRSDEYGIKTGEVKVDFKAAMKRKDEAVVEAREGIEERLDEVKGITLIRGEACFTGPKQISIDLNEGGRQTLTADHIIINTGASSRVPDVEGMDEVDWLTSKTALDLKESPEHLLIVGGGYIGLEFAQIFSRLGSKVTVIESNNQVMDGEDKDVADEMQKILEEEGITFHVGSEVDKVKQGKDGAVQVSIISEDKKTSGVTGSHLLFAVGTVPNTKALKLEAAGIDTDKKDCVEVDDYLETSQKGIFAVGDVKGGPEFTHISYDDHRVVLERLLEGKKRSIENRPVPYAVFTDPQLGRVGLSEEEAKKKKIKVKIAKMPMTKVSRANETGHTKGFMKVLIDAENDQILGVAILGMQGAEMMAMLQIAMMGKLTYQQLRDG
ncbi:mercuric reductase, partial [Persicitalea sp.]|uniref:mercuric reductase n=1 Tax=Persicitalea sp. TaxID=3100273 RepID=UPI0035931FD4